MGIGKFLRQVAGGVGRTVNWLNQNPGAQGVVGSIPGAGIALKALNPIATMASKAYGKELPEVNNIGDAVKVGRELYNSGREALGEAKQLVGKGRDEYGKLKTNLKTKNYSSLAQQASSAYNKGRSMGNTGKSEMRRARGLV